jgi:allophanate hydrolase
VVSDIFREIAASGAAPAWIRLVEERQVHAAASSLESARAAGAALPLYGVPFAVKDNIDVAGIPPRLGVPSTPTFHA